jgi:hypothetical protein
MWWLLTARARSVEAPAAPSAGERERGPPDAHCRAVFPDLEKRTPEPVPVDATPAEGSVAGLIDLDRTGWLESTRLALHPMQNGLPDAKAMRTGSPDATGAFLLSAPAPADYVFVAHLPQSLDRSVRRPATRKVRLEPGTTLSLGRIALLADVALEGRVTLPNGSPTLCRMSVSLSFEGAPTRNLDLLAWRDERFEYSQRQAVCERDGSFRVEGLAPDTTYAIHAWSSVGTCLSRDVSVQWIGGARTVELPVPPAFRLDLRLDLVRLTLLVLHDGSPVPRIVVRHAQGLLALPSRLSDTCPPMRTGKWSSIWKRGAHSRSGSTIGATCRRVSSCRPASSLSIATS